MPATLRRRAAAAAAVVFVACTPALAATLFLADFESDIVGQAPTAGWDLTFGCSGCTFEVVASSNIGTGRAVHFHDNNSPKRIVLRESSTLVGQEALVVTFDVYEPVTSSNPLEVRLGTGTLTDEADECFADVRIGQGTVVARNGTGGTSDRVASNAYPTGMVFTVEIVANSTSGLLVYTSSGGIDENVPVSTYDVYVTVAGTQTLVIDDARYADYNGPLVAFELATGRNEAGCDVYLDSIHIDELINDFALSVVPTTATVETGQSAAYTLKVRKLGGFQAAVSLATVGTLPAGTQVTIVPNSVAPTPAGAEAVVTAQTAATTPTGRHTLRIRGQGGGLQHDIDLVLEVVSDRAAPLITVTAPTGTEDPASLGDAFSITGTAVDQGSSGLASVVVSTGQPNLGTPDAWEFYVPLALGRNRFDVVATDHDGNAAAAVVQLQRGFRLDVVELPAVGGLVHVSPDRAGYVPPDMTVTLTAEPAADYVFARWYGPDVPAGAETDNPLTLDGSADRRIVAIFLPDESAPGPAIAVAPASLAFGPVHLGETADQTMYVLNVGRNGTEGDPNPTADGTLTGAASAFATGSPFEYVSAATYELEPGEVAAISVRFAPTTAGPASATISLSGASAAVTVPARGHGGDGDGASLHLTHPNGGQALKYGDALDVTWTTGGVIDAVTIELLRRGVPIRVLATDVDNDDAESIVVPQDLLLDTRYRVRIVGAAAEDESDADLSMIMPDPPVITEHPQDATAIVDDQVVFTVAATGVGPLHYHWFLAGTPIGADSPTLTLDPVVAAYDGAHVYCQVSDTYNAAPTQSDDAVLTVVAFVLTIDGPGRVLERQPQPFQAFAGFGPHGVFEATPFVTWEVDPPQAGAFDALGFGWFTAAEHETDTPATIRASFATHGDVHTAAYDVLIHNIFNVRETDPAPGTVLHHVPQIIRVHLGEDLNAATLNIQCARLVRSANGTFDDGNDVDVPIQSLAIVVGPGEPPGAGLRWIEADLTGADLPADQYRFSLITSPARAAGRILSFDGVDDVVNIPDSTTLRSVEDAVTLEFWVRIPAGGGGRIAGKGSAYQGSGNCTFLCSVLSDRIFWGVATPDAYSWANVSAAPVSIAPNVWHHIACTYDGVTLRVFVNGTAIYERDWDRGAMNVVTRPLRFGADQDDSTIHFHGDLDEVRLWNVARTAEQIRANLNATLPGTDPTLVGYWRFEGVNVQTVADSASYHNDGTRGLDAVEASDDPTSTTAAAQSDCLVSTFGEGLDGEYDAVAFPPSGDFLPGGNFVYTWEMRFWAADTDADGDVDLTDFQAFLLCFNGPGRSYANHPQCPSIDFDDDHDVDLSDFSVFLNCFSGPGRSPPPGCPLAP